MTGRREDVLKAAAQQMCDAGMRAIGLQGDVRNKEDCERWAQAVTDQLGSLDILVNCAAGAHPCRERGRSQHARLRHLLHRSVSRSHACPTV